MRRPGRRRARGFSMIELVVGLGLLAVCIGAMAEFAVGETRGVAVSLERTLANQVLGELQACMGRRSRSFYQRGGFPARPEGFTALHASLLEDHPLVLPADPEEAPASPVAAELVRQMRALGIQRFLLYEDRGPPEQGGYGLVTFTVRYRDSQGRTKEVFSFEVVR